MAKFGKYAGYVLALFMIAMGGMKFFGNVPIFELLENNLDAKYGITAPWVEPGFKYLTGVLEIIAGLLLAFGQRFKGGLLSLAVIGGAILSHLTVLGINTPMSSEPGAEQSPMLFIMAVMFFMVAGFVTWASRKTLSI